MSSLCPFEAITWGAKMLSEFQNSPSEKAKNGAKRLIFAQKLGGCLSRKGPNLPFCLLETEKIASPPSILPSHFCTICPSEIFNLFSLFSFLFVSIPCPFFPFLRSPCQKAGPPLPAASCPHCPFAHAPTAKPRPRCPYLPKFRCITMTSVKKPRIFSPYGLRRLCRFREKTYICRF